MMKSFLTVWMALDMKFAVDNLYDESKLFIFNVCL